MCKIIPLKYPCILMAVEMVYECVTTSIFPFNFLNVPSGTLYYVETSESFFFFLWILIYNGFIFLDGLSSLTMQFISLLTSAKRGEVKITHGVTHILLEMKSITVMAYS